MLASEIEAWTCAEHPDEDRLGPGEILARAAALGELIDDFNVAQIPLDVLDRLDVGDLAGHWEQSRKFLQFALKTWPDLLGADGRVDASQLRNLKLERQSEALPRLYAERPVVAAGSTGSIPASAELLAAIARLPRGALVLPGLDVTLDADQAAALRDPQQNPHGHPQYGLVKLLDRLGVPPGAVEELAPDDDAVRSRLLNLSLALPGETAHWPQSGKALFAETDAAAALNRFSLIAARNEAEQATSIALAARDALSRNQSVGIISPDRNLARRIAGHLARFGVEVDDAAGTPLFQSQTGRLLRQILALALNPVSPVDLMALLHSRHVALGRSRDEIARLARLIDLGLLRGLPVMADIGALIARARDNASGTIQDRVVQRLSEADASDISAFLSDLDAAFAPLIDLLQQRFGPIDLAGTLGRTFDALILAPGAAAPDVSGLDEWRSFALELAQSGPNRPQLDGANVTSALAGLMQGVSVRSRLSGRADISIWGQLEARLQNRDLTVVCGLNETIWPEVADPGPWMGRNMRMAVGLEPPERQHGLAAHDFLMAAGQGDVILTYAERIGTSPASPSRLVERLTGLIGEDRAKDLKARGEVWLRAAQSLDVPEGPVRPAARPEPGPPAAKRARALSVTEVEKLFFSPYDIYAKRTLRLYPLEPLGQPISARDRGTVLHQVFADFVAEGCDPTSPNAMAELMALAEAQFARLDSDPDHRDIWHRRFQTSGEKFLAFERERDARVAERHAEVDISFTFDIAGEDFKLYGRADRIDLLRDGTCEILDFKTGNPPDKTSMQQLLAPQLPLEAFIVAQGGFGEIGRRDTSALKYIKIANGPEAFVESDFATPDGLDVMQSAEASFAQLSRYMQHFLLSDTNPMPADFRPRPKQRFAGDYDHLARRSEWAGMAGGEEE